MKRTSYELILVKLGKLNDAELIRLLTQIKMEQLGRITMIHFNKAAIKALSENALLYKLRKS